MKNAKSIRSWSLISGLSIFIMALAAGIAYGMIFPTLYREADPMQTLQLIEANKGAFRVMNLLFTVILVTDLLVSYGFCVIFIPISKRLAVLTSLTRFIYSGILAVALYMLFRKNMEAFLRIWSFGLFLFGFHLMFLGSVLLHVHGRWLVKLLGVLLLIGGVGYSLIHGIETIVPQSYQTVMILEDTLSIPMAAGELLLGFWLVLTRGKMFIQEKILQGGA
ncbi:DUF4386 domain-containing protein [uncultured Sphaerochaeta sp.]|uniref:DUF4386 domain-containing protein n=1 Tax=uncultured Sphaerochaeta sp. TaxID=886478 RepID=UPI0029CA392C|nr:DUF4386 domain-containing protein [uncultured Sphaerochaeta sp.]